MAIVLVVLIGLSICLSTCSEDRDKTKKRRARSQIAARQRAKMRRAAEARQRRRAQSKRPQTQGTRTRRGRTRERASSVASLWGNARGGELWVQAQALRDISAHHQQRQDFESVVCLAGAFRDARDPEIKKLALRLLLEAEPDAGGMILALAGLQRRSVDQLVRLPLEDRASLLFRSLVWVLRRESMFSQRAVRASLNRLIAFKLALTPALRSNLATALMHRVTPRAGRVDPQLFTKITALGLDLQVAKGLSVHVRNARGGQQLNMIDALGSLGPKARSVSEPALATLARNRSPTVRRHAEAALRKVRAP
jgi:hypothetical protein